jgi:hypothetical protein
MTLTGILTSGEVVCPVDVTTTSIRSSAIERASTSRLLSECSGCSGTILIEAATNACKWIVFAEERVWALAIGEQRPKANNPTMNFFHTGELA